MPIEFRCERCQKLLRTPDGTAGKQAKCPTCGAIVSVPAAGTGPPAGPLSSGAASPQATFDNPYQAPAQHTAPGYYAPPTVSRDRTALISLVLGLCGFMGFCICAPVVIPVAITGMVLGIKALKTEDRPMAIAGITLCIIQLVLCLLYVLMMVWIFVAADGPGFGDF